MGNLYILNTLTNMHVGSGEMNFGVVDNQVQRDVLTSYPTIHSSSLKGALREHFKCNEKSDEIISYIFGGNAESDEVKSGKFKFFSGNLLILPVRSNKLPFYRVTSPDILDSFIECVDNFFISISENLKKALINLKEKSEALSKPVILVSKLSKDSNKIKVEDYLAEELIVDNLNCLEEVFGENLCIMPTETFKKTVSELPVIARNCLENGISKNLWYEEVVPREAKFYFTVLEGEKHFDTFNKVLTEDIIQIGASASIGYGYTKIANIKSIGDKNE